MADVEATKSATEVAKGSLWGIAGNMSFNLISFIYVIIVARAVSPDDLGLFYLSIGIITMIGAFDSLGTGPALARFVPYFRGKGQSGKILALLKSSYAIVMVSATILAIVLWLASDWVGVVYQNERLPEALRLFSVLLIIKNVFEVSNAYLRGRSDMRGMQLNSNLQNLMKLVLTLALFWLYGASVLTISAGYILSCLLAVFFSFMLVRSRTMDLTQPEAGAHVTEILKEVLPFGIALGLIQAVGSISNSVDKVLLGYMLDPAQATATVAIYSIASMMAMLALIFPTSVGAIFLPVMSGLFSRGKLDQMRAVTESAQRWLLFATVPIASIMMAFSHEMLKTFYGREYAAGAIAMSIIVFAVFVRSFSSMLSLSLASMKKVNIQLKAVALIAILNIILDILMIPGFGMVGAAIAFLISSACFTFIMYRYTSRFLKFRFSPGFYRLVAASLITMALILFLKPLLLQGISAIPLDTGEMYLEKFVYLAYMGILSGISMAVFFALVIVLRCFRHEDAELAQKALAKARLPEGVNLLAGRLIRMCVTEK